MQLLTSITTLHSKAHISTPSKRMGKTTLNVKRRAAELIRPAKPTPHEFKSLSDLDNQVCNRYLIPVISFYAGNPSTNGRLDPVGVIRRAIGEALVYYYPFAGRLREDAGDRRKLVVECTGEGVLFVEADADASLSDLGSDEDQLIRPPFPFDWEEFFDDVPGSDGVLNCPLLLIQVTRLRCGGFVYSQRVNHVICDAPGLAQLMSAVAELARGFTAPTVSPVWDRHILTARQPPCVSYPHHEYDAVPSPENTVPSPDLVNRSFFIGPDHISALRRRVPSHLAGRFSGFDLVTGYLWRCRTVALSPEPDEQLRMIVVVNAKLRLQSMIPAGYYGNGFAFPAAISTAGDLISKPFHYAAELVAKAKGGVDEEYVRSTVDLMAMREYKSHFTLVRTYLVSDVTRARFADVNFGWGKAVYGGPAAWGRPGVTSYYIPFKNKDGVNGIIVTISLPAKAMESFAREVEGMLTTMALPPSSL